MIAAQLQWEGVFVPVVPSTLMDVLDSPVPALVGVQAPFAAPLDQEYVFAFDGVVVLDLDARQSTVRRVGEGGRRGGVLRCWLKLYGLLFCLGRTMSALLPHIFYPGE